MSRSVCSAFAAVVVLGAAQGAMAANLLVNGGFEDTVTPPGSAVLYGAGADLGGWRVVGSSSNNAVMTVATDYAEPAVRFPAFSGLASLDLTASGNTLDGGVSQQVNLAVGASYMLTFWLANTAGDSGAGGNNGFYLLPSAVRVGITGQADTVFTNGVTSLPSTSNWLQASIVFTATSTSTDIAIINQTAGSDSAALLDDVSLSLVSAVPEPASWAILLAGLGLVGWMRRRRCAG